MLGRLVVLSQISTGTKKACLADLFCARCINKQMDRHYYLGYIEYKSVLYWL
ncbi:hypothetical protein Sps_05346 [Shewanella psychrophila]|uniref:Uncharacterized protein n=1 Tax=Shewanella psychrophila TaxID=225848 RepID=A0A1S6HXY7_9GAMM|nr:hypothetical protein Sps_05346 [Shewanella psychrophila]